MALQRKAKTNTGEERKIIAQILRARKLLDTVGGTPESDDIKFEVSCLLSRAYVILVNGTKGGIE